MTKYHSADFRIKLTTSAEIKKRMTEDFRDTKDGGRRYLLKKGLISLAGEHTRTGGGLVYDSMIKIKENVYEWIHRKFSEVEKESESLDLLHVSTGQLMLDTKNLPQLLLIKSGLKSSVGSAERVYEDEFNNVAYEGVDGYMQDVIDVSLKFSGVSPGEIDDYISKAGRPHARSR